MTRKREHTVLAHGIEKSVFRNGLTVVSERLRGSHSLTIGFWVRAGTRHESLAQHGASHFLEHLLFKGTKKRTALDLAKSIDRVGGDFNAFTSRENTCFHITMLNKDLNLAMGILLDVFCNSQLSPTEIKRERDVILQEMTMVEENPEELAFDLFMDHVYEGGPLGRAILGSRESIKRMTRSQIAHYYDTFYQPSNLVISVAGDVEHAQVVSLLGDLIEVEQIVRTHAKRDKRSNSRQLMVGQDGLVQVRRTSGCSREEELRRSAKTVHHRPYLNPITESIWADYPSEQTHLIWAVPAPAFTDPLRLPAVLVNERLGGGMSSILFQEVREKKGLAYSVYSNLQPYSDAGLLTVYAATEPSKARYCLELIDGAVSKFCRNGISRSELMDLKEHLRGSILLSADDSEARMISLAKAELYLGNPVSAQKVVGHIMELSLGSVHRAIKRCFGDGRGRSVLALGSRPKFAAPVGGKWHRIAMP